MSTSTLNALKNSAFANPVKKRTEDEPVKDRTKKVSKQTDGQIDRRTDISLDIQQDELMSAIAGELTQERMTRYKRINPKITEVQEDRIIKIQNKYREGTRKNLAVDRIIQEALDAYLPQLEKMILGKRR